MNKSDEKTRRSIAESLDSKESGPIAGFDETWLAAEARYLAEKRRYRMATGVAISLALIAVFIGMLPPDGKQQLPNFELAEELMTTTLWNAPSDALMPEYPTDIYQEVPEMLVPTDLSEGTML